MQKNEKVALVGEIDNELVSGVKKLQDEIFSNSHKLEKLIGNERETINSLVLPFLKLLGYETGISGNLSAEYDADYGNIKGDKVDYVLLDKASNPLMFIECKQYKANLDTPQFKKQIQGYFANLYIKGCHFGILTDGIKYRFFSNLDGNPSIDEEPFFVFNLQNYNSQDIETLKMFVYDGIDTQKIHNWAKICRAINDNVINPSQDFMKFIIERSSLTTSKITEKVRKEYTPEIEKILENILNSRYCPDTSMGSNPPTPQIAKSFTQSKEGSVQRFWEEAITEVLSSSSTPLLAEEIWAKITEKYSKDQIPTNNSNPVKRVSEQCLYILENVEPVSKNPSKFVLRTTQWTEQDYLAGFKPEIVKMYEDIKGEISKFADMSINCTKVYISFKINANDKNFVGFILQQSKIRVFFTLEISKFSDPSKKLIDTSSKNTGNGRTEFFYEDTSDKAYLLSIIKQSYDKLR